MASLLLSTIQRQREKELGQTALRFSFTGFARSTVFAESLVKVNQYQDERVGTAQEIERKEREIETSVYNGGEVTESDYDYLNALKKRLEEQTKEYFKRQQVLDKSVFQVGSLATDKFALKPFRGFEIKMPKPKKISLFSSKLKYQTKTKFDKIKPISELIKPISDLI